MDNFVVFCMVVVIVILVAYLVFMFRQDSVGKSSPPAKAAEGEPAGSSQLASGSLSGASVPQGYADPVDPPVLSYSNGLDYEIPVGLMLDYIMGNLGQETSEMLKRKLLEQMCYLNPPAERVHTLKFRVSMESADGSEELFSLEDLKDIIVPKKETDITRQDSAGRKHSSGKAPRLSDGSAVRSVQQDLFGDDGLDGDSGTDSGSESGPEQVGAPAASSGQPDSGGEESSVPSGPGRGEKVENPSRKPADIVKDLLASGRDASGGESGESVSSDKGSGTDAAEAPVGQKEQEAGAGPGKESSRELSDVGKDGPLDPSLETPCVDLPGPTVQDSLFFMDADPVYEFPQEPVQDVSSSSGEVPVSGEVSSTGEGGLFQQESSGTDVNSGGGSDGLVNPSGAAFDGKGFPEDVLEVLRNPTEFVLPYCVYISHRFHLGIDYGDWDPYRGGVVMDEVREKCRDYTQEDFCNLVRCMCSIGASVADGMKDSPVDFAGPGVKTRGKNIVIPAGH